MLRRLFVTVLVVAATTASTLSCGRPARFPRGGAIRATGLCEAHLDPVASPTSEQRRPRDAWLAQPASGAKDDEGYSVYSLGNAAGNIGLQFDHGRLTSLSIEDPSSEAFNPPLIRYATPPPRWRAEGARDETFVEGRSYDVQVKVVSPPGRQESEIVRVTFEGERVRVAWRGSEALAECAWEP